MSKSESLLNSPPIHGKHLLQTGWTLWFNKPNGLEENNIKVNSFKTVEDFYRLYCRINEPLDMVESSSYLVFRNGIVPTTTDVNNCNGGRLMYYYDKTSNESNINEQWLDILLACIGEQFPHSEYISGCVLNSREHQILILLWLQTTDRIIIKCIGSKLKQLLHLTASNVLFQPHSDVSSHEYNNVIVI